MTDNPSEPKVNYLSIRADFSFSEETNKSYGLLDIIGTNKEMINLDLAINYEHTALANEYVNIDLKSEEKLFNSLLREREKNYRSQVMKQEAINNFSVSDMELLFEKIENDEQEIVEEIITEKLEDIIKETVDLNVYTEFLTEDQLQELRPDLFETVSEESDDDDEEEETSDESKKEKEKNYRKQPRVVLKGNQDYNVEEEVELKCTPVVSPVAGTSVNHLKSGDRIAVKINDRSDKAKEIRKMLTNKHGKTLGTIREINFKKTIAKYEILIELRNNIYGKLKVGDVKIETKGLNASSSNRNKRKSNKKKSSLFSIMIIIIIVLLIVGGIIYFI